MLRPFLLVGVGGSGGKTLRAIREALLLKLQQEHWDRGWPEGWQFIHVDSPTVQDGSEFPSAFLPSDNYLSLVPQSVNYESIYGSIASRTEPRLKADIEKPLPWKKDVKIPVEKGAGAYRAIGRAIAVAKLSDIHAKAKTALSKLDGNDAREDLKALTKLLGLPEQKKLPPVVIIVSSIAGGSGAGMFIDVTEAVKSAAGGQPWGDQVFGVLYAPDVFAGINPDAINPNALGAMAETMSGLWNNNPTEATNALYKSQGVLTANTVEYSMGPGLSYIVGRKNGLVDFASQTGVYKATAASLVAWMTDVKIQGDIDAYAFTNLRSLADDFPDNSNLKRASDDLPPFSSLGFGRVTLGTERFFEYSAERMAKEALETIMNKHLESDPKQKEKTEEQWRIFYADLNEGRFMSDSGLYEETEENNQVLEALLPDLSELQAKLKSSVISMAQQGMPKEGHSFNNWVLKICNAFDVNLPGLLDEMAKLRHDKARQWVEQKPEEILRLVSKTISQQGLPVTVELLKRLIQQCARAIRDLKEERGKNLGEVASLQNLVSQALGSAATMAAIPPQNPTVAQAIHQVEMAFYWRSMADLKLEAMGILEDFSQNFLEPLNKVLEGGHASLKKKIDDPKLLDGRDNPYAEWPNFKQDSVPTKFYPAPNEKLLIDFKEYPNEFDALVNSTVNDPKVDAKRIVIDQLIMGLHGLEELKVLDKEKQWTIVSQSQIWVPLDRSHQLKESAPQAAKFEVLTDHMGYLDRARLWIEMPGKPFRSFLDQTIATFLADLGDKAEQQRNQTKFIQEFTSAVASANPLVELNQSLLSQVHGSAGGKTSALFSPIPVDVGDELFAPLKETLVNLGFWKDKESEGWFVGPGAGAKKKEIDIFTQIKIPVQPMVMGSVMAPIAESWSRMSHKKDSRTAFMKWRKGRTLSEAIPAHHEIWTQMLRGWYVMRLLNMFEQAPKDESYSQKGPKVSIWVSPSTGFRSFPYPLYYPEIAPDEDLAGVVIQSLTIAIVNCYEETSLAPLEPYKRLHELGHTSKELSELSNWVRTGVISGVNAPVPLPDRAGSSNQSLAERQSACVAWLTNELELFKEEIKTMEDDAKKIQEQQGFKSYSVSWEIRSEIIEALSELISSIVAIKPEKSGL